MPYLPDPGACFHRGCVFRVMVGTYTGGGMDGLNFIAASVGNTRTRIGQFLDGRLKESKAFDNDALPEIVQQVLRWWEGMDDSSAVLLASVNDAVARSLEAMIEDQLSIAVYHVGEDVPVPIGRRLDPETITGIDRLLNAAAAYARVRQACIIIDAGTAITVDFVDGDGTFHGGAIAPGARMQLQALHEGTAGLPELRFVAPDDEAFGRSTSQAMLQSPGCSMRTFLAAASPLLNTFTL